MNREMPIFFMPPNLSDEASVALCDFMQDLILALESHYLPQLRRHTRLLESKRLLDEPEWVDEEKPF